MQSHEIFNNYLNKKEGYEIINGKKIKNKNIYTDSLNINNLNYQKYKNKIKESLSLFDSFSEKSLYDIEIEIDKMLMYLEVFAFDTNIKRVYNVKSEKIYCCEIYSLVLEKEITTFYFKIKERIYNKEKYIFIYDVTLKKEYTEEEKEEILNDNISF